MTNTAPSLTSSRIEALLPLARGWLMTMACVVLALAERCGGRHRRLPLPFVHRLERMLENWVFLQADLLAPPPLRRRHAKRPSFAPYGFRHALRRGDVFRRATRTRCCARSLTARLRFVHAIASDPARAIARLIKRLNLIAACGLAARGLIAVNPPARVLFACAPALTPACADSS